MPRIKRAIAENTPHHITARGTDRKLIFVDDQDRARYLALLTKTAASVGVRFWGYCLMPNHVHFIAVPLFPNSFWQLFKYAHARYSAYFHIRHGGCGHLWQGRYFSCALDGPAVWRSLAYVELNPVRANLTGTATAHHWSSAAFHTGAAASGLPLDPNPWLQDWSPSAWCDLLDSRELDEAFNKSLRSATLTGRPIGDTAFVCKMEHRLARILQVQRAGRKPFPLALTA